MTNKEIARSLKSTASMIDLTGGNPHRSRAMSNAARTIERLQDSVVSLLNEGQLTSIRGIGDKLAEQIRELIETGTFEAREELLGAIPAGVLDIMRVKGLGAKKVRALWQQLNIISLTELEQAAASGKLATIDGFGAKTEANILNNVKLLKQYSKSRRYADVIQYLTPPLKSLEDDPGIEQVALSGPLRRKLEVIDHIDLVIVATDDVHALNALQQVFITAEDTPFVIKDSSIEGTLENGLPMLVHLASNDTFGSMLWKTTGSKEHIDLFMDSFGEPGPAAVEQELYSKADIAFVPAELREGSDELTHAKSRSLPNLIEVADLKGSLHNHSTYSDGAHSLKDMADRARGMGLSYFGICDHSRSLVIANGLSIDEVEAQQKEIQALNASYASESPPFRIFSGIESDILSDGSLDYPDEVLASFDFVVASVHTRMNMDIEEATARIITAIENPYTSILGHPTGRILLVREGYPVDYSRILDACAAHQVAVELNANPYRLDLDWRWIREATKRGVYVSINPDAHAMDGLDDVQWGTEVARKGWLTADQCLNALSLDAFEQWLTNR